LEILAEKMARDSELIQHHESKGFSLIEEIKGKHQELATHEELHKKHGLVFAV
jgi:hypothetical protein